MMHKIAALVGTILETPVIACTLGALILMPITFFMIDSLQKPKRYLGHGDGGRKD